MHAFYKQYVEFFLPKQKCLFIKKYVFLMSVRLIISAEEWMQTSWILAFLFAL
jgi:hypothetical protein